MSALSTLAQFKICIVLLKLQLDLTQNCQITSSLTEAKQGDPSSSLLFLCFVNDIF